MRYEPSIPLISYVNRFSRRPGEDIACYVSARSPGTVDVKLVRVVSTDPNPEGPGLIFDDLSSVLDQRHEVGPQATTLGSFAISRGTVRREAGTPSTWTALCQTSGLDGDASIISEEVEGRSVGALVVNGDVLRLALNRPGTEGRGLSVSGLRAGKWYRVWGSYDPVSGAAAVGHLDLATGLQSVERGDFGNLELASTFHFMIAATDSADPRSNFTGKIEDPAILTRYVDAWDDPLVRLESTKSDLVVGFDFSYDIDAFEVRDIGPQGAHGDLVNAPGRGMVGARWSGFEHCWRHAPDEYGAIKFHADDLEDCRWTETFRWRIPDDLASGAYAFALTSAEGDDCVPFYVLPKKEGPFAKIALLIPTFTYQAYANFIEDSTVDPAYEERQQLWNAFRHNPLHHHEFGHSTYDLHADGAGVSFSSRLRPDLTMRPGFLTWLDKRGSGVHHYAGDGHITAWLRAKGLDFDVVTDEDLDDEGVELIKNYELVMTSTHPEYHTGRTLDALEAYKRLGGNLMYLGGNGFYWRIARNPQRPHLIEVRRAEGGIRTWEAQPGEYFFQTDGYLGGLWRRHRRPPQQLVGIGFTGQGPFEGTHYTILPEAREPDIAWIFEGVDGDVLGDYGLSGGGAAGYELDRASVPLGSPENIRVLARSGRPSPAFVPAHEEMLGRRITATGETPEDLIRAEITYFDTQWGGAVFSVGSITFCGSLWQDGFNGPVSQVVENVVRRFSKSVRSAL